MAPVDVGVDVGRISHDEVSAILHTHCCWGEGAAVRAACHVQQLRVCRLWDRAPCLCLLMKSCMIDNVRTLSSVELSSLGIETVALLEGRRFMS